MELRKVEGIENLLESLSRVEAPGKTHHVVYPWHEYSRVPGRDIGFWYSAERCQYSTLRRLVLQELKRLSHAVSDRLADGIVLAFTLMPRTQDALTEFERLLGSFVGAAVSQFLLIPTSALMKVMELGQSPKDDLIGFFGHGPFRYAPLAGDLMEEVRDRIVGIGLSNFLPELDKFFGCIAVYREPQRTSIVDFASLGFGGCRSPEVIDVMQSYFDDVAGTLFEGFWQEHMKTQYLCAAAGAAVLDRTSLESLPGTGWLTIFWGFALFAGNGMISFITEEGHRKGSIAVRVHSAGIDLNEAERRVELELKEQLGPGSHKVFLSLENFARLVARSRELQNRGYVEESFTLLMVALESILANRDSISSTLSQRVGVIWAVSQDKQFKDSIRLIQSLYDARSKFVHQGQPIAQNLLDVLSEVCRAVFFAAYRSQARSTNSQEEAWKDRWFSLLDYLSACFDIGVSVDPGVASIAGVLKSPSVTAKAPI